MVVCGRITWLAHLVKMPNLDNAGSGWYNVYSCQLSCVVMNFTPGPRGGTPESGPGREVGYSVCSSRAQGMLWARYYTYLHVLV